MKTECQCEVCQNACTYRPGWFMPGEAEKAAELLGMTLKEFFDTYLGVDYWVAYDFIFLLAPALKGMKPGGEYPGDPRGECIFFEGDKCKIHEAKPYECAHTYHDTSDEETQRIHDKIARAWNPYQDQIRELLGREPEANPFEPLTIFDTFKL